MAYVLKKTDGTTLVTIEDGSINTSATPLTLVGRNYSGYGQSINQNLIKITENFAHNVQPSKPLTGQLWFDTGSKTLKAYNGIRFKPLTYVDSASSSPSDSVKGDLWFNETEQKLYFYNGTKYVLVGPQFTGLASNNLVLPAQVQDTDGVTHNILKHQLQNAVDGSLSVVAITSGEEFTLGTSSSITGYSTIKKGITFPNVNNLGVSSNALNTYYLWGTASDSLSLGGSLASEYVLKDNPTFNSQVSINSITGITINAGSLRLYVEEPFGNKQANITAGNGNLIKFNARLSNQIANVINVSSSGDLALLPSSDANAVTDIGSATYPFNDVWSKGRVYTNYIDATNDSLGNPRAGVINGVWSLTAGSSMATVGADLAERYHADAEYEVGTVLVVGGTNEVTACSDFRQPVAGIVSANPGYTMNAEAGTNATHPYLALKGRVPCKVVGPVKKGSMLVTCPIAGHAKQIGFDTTGLLPIHLVGIALEDFDGELGVIEVKV